MSYTSLFGGSTIQTSNQTYLALALSADTTLIWPRENAPSASVVADTIDVTPSSSGFSVIMPDARYSSLGVVSIINNLSGSYTFSVKDSTGSVIQSIAVGTTWVIYLTNNSTAAGTWRSFQLGAQAGSVNVAAIAGSGLKAIGSSLNQAMSPSVKSSNATIFDADRAKVILWTGAAGTLTLTAAATVGSDWFVGICNSGTSSIAVTPPSGTIDGAASKTFAASSSAYVFTDGTNYYSLGYGLSSGSTSFDYTTINVAGTGDYTITGVQLNRISYLLTGVLTGNRNLVVPNTVQQYWINNGTTGAFTLTVKTAAGTGATITQGSQSIVYCDGTNVVAGVSGTSFPISIGNGGTGATTAATARTALGSTATGNSLFTAASAAAARTTLGSTAVGDALFVAASASAALTAMAGGTLTGALSITGLLTAAGTVAVNESGGGGAAVTIGSTTNAKSSLLAADINFSIGQYVGANIREIIATAAQPFYIGNSSANALATVVLCTNSIGRIGIANNGEVNFAKAAYTNPYNIGNSSTAFTVDLRNSNVQYVTMTGNVSGANFTLSNALDGQTCNIFITQDGTGSRTLGYASNIKWPGGIAGVLSAVPASVDMLTLTYRGATGFYYASLTRGYA